MKYCVIFASDYGFTEKNARMVCNKLNGELFDLRTKPMITIQEYDFVIIGSNIKGGNIHSLIKTFISKNFSELKNKKTAFFSTSMTAVFGEKDAEKQLLENLSKTGLKPTVISVMPGGIDLSKNSKIGFFLKRFFKTLSKTFEKEYKIKINKNENNDFTSEKKVDEFIKKIK